MIRTYERLLHDSLARSAADVPDKVAVAGRDERLTYRDLDARASRLARALQERGVKRGDRVAIYLDNSPTVLVSVYAALRAGAAFMVINPQTKEDKLRYILSDSGARALIAEGRLAAALSKAVPAVPAVGTVVLRGEARTEIPGALDLAKLLADAAGTPEPVGTIPLDLAALIYTSGSTGNPKGVMLSHQNMVFAQQSLCEYLRLDRSDRILDVVPLAFDYGLYQALMAVHLGATLVLEASFAFPSQVIERIVEEEVTVFPGVPTIFATLLSLHRHQPLSLPSIKRITNTAAHLPDDYVPGLQEMSPEALIYKMYGLTECKRVSYLDPERVSSKPSSVGKAIPGTEVFVLDDRGEPVAPGETGVLHVRGPHVMMGYWNLPDETERMLKPGPYPGERMLCTHDYFKTDDEGFLYFLGRSDDIIKSRGEKVSPVEVENAINGIPGVKEAAVIGVADELLGQAVRAYVVLDDAGSMSEREFRRHCMGRMESYMVPRDVVFLEDLPKTGSGKVRKKDLAEGI
jgi:amino acid adenylation domain-containing protein